MILDQDTVIMVSLPALFAGLFFALWIESLRSASTFRLVHLVTDAEGRGSKYAVAYICILIVGCWGVWALLLRNLLTEWFWTSLLGVFLLGAMTGTAANVIARIKGANAPDADAGDQPKEKDC